MHLKHVKIYGFKTFADRTEFSLEGGLAAVVGSNGCGKSNIVDSLLWGLGEGNARQLRAASAADIIFNGSANRKPLSFAEVQITFDNEDGSLPAPTSEVTISRKVNRAGESEYRINKTVCRMKDIHELLADSGLGRSGYAIVGQREIDAALSASPEERRGWVDEAAGVQRYRQRKVEAQRRLASAQQHLQRTRDILTELESQREPLREDAQKARQWKFVSDQMRSLEVVLLGRECLEAKQRLQEIEQKQQESHDAAAKARAAAVDAEHRVLSLESDLEQADRFLESGRNERQAAVVAIEGGKANQRLVQQKIESIAEARRELQESREDVAAFLKTAESEVKAAEQEKTADEQALAELQASMGGVDAEYAALNSKLKEVEKQVAAARLAEAERMKMQAAASHRRQRTQELKREIAGIEADEPALNEGIAEAAEAAETLKAALDQAEAELKAAKDDLDQFQSDVRNAGTGLRDQLQKRGALTGRIQGVQASLNAHEGLSQGPKAVMDAVKSGQIHGRFLPVGEAVKAKPEVAVAIDAALGGSVNDLIVDSEEEAKDAIAWLKQNRKGRATFQPIPLMRPQEVSRDLRDLANRPRVLGIATELVDFEPRLRPVMESLLNRILIVQDLDTALQLARTTRRPFSRIVTLDGEIVHAAGSVSGGTQASGGNGLVQRRAELHRLQTQLEQIEAEIKRLEGLQANSDQQGAEKVTRVKELSQAADEGRAEYREAAAYVSDLEREKAGTDKERQRLEKELASLSAQEGRIPDAIELEPLESERQQLLENLAVKTAEVESFSARQKELGERAAKSRSRLESALRRIQHSQDNEAKRHERLAQLEQEKTAQEAEAARLVQELEILEGRHVAIGERLEADSEKRTHLAAAIQTARGEGKTARLQVEMLTEGIHKQEVDRARWESKRAAAQQRLVEEYEMTEATFEDEVEVLEFPNDAEQQVSRMKRELKAMGEVNLGAIEAFDRLTERFDELNWQQADIETGIADVEASIRELDGQTQERFAHTLNAVQVHFANLVRRLFGGGDGALIATNPENILDTGLEIEVTLPGKRRQALGLLSGGERSLCAMAFLFALLEVKTSPLVVLDEVDAPLDGHNLDRYIQLLKDFSKRCQLIVITHNPNTIAAAPVWLGVTMKEPGVSTLIPYKTSAGKDDLPQKPSSNLAVIGS